jgi:uncharacterized RDD family membrane protein YckC
MTEKIQYAGFWKRLIADFLDSTLLDLLAGGVELFVLFGIYLIKKMTPLSGGGDTLPFFEFFSSVTFEVFFISLRFLLAFFYFSWGTFWYSTTLGKKSLSIYVVSKDLKPVTLKQSIKRFLGYLVSYLPLGLGFSTIIFHPKRLGLHDMIAGTVSIIKPRA